MSAPNELDIAKAVATGQLPSPTVFMNSWMVAVRLSGTGCAYRPASNEFSIRPKEIWCSASMLRRFLGVICLWNHPSTGITTSEYFGSNCIGTIIYVYVHEELDEPWGIMRCIDKNAAELIAGGFTDTSPGIAVDPENIATMEIDGRTCIIEHEPLLVDHLAIVWCGRDGDENCGVWTRSNESGTRVDSAKTDWTAAYDYGVENT